MSIRELAKARTCDAVVSAAKAEFERLGYNRATVRAIASGAGLSTGAVFSHFLSKGDLYRAVYGHDPLTPEEGRALRFEVEELRAALSDARRMRRA